MRHEKPSLLILMCVTAVTVAILFSGCSKPFVPYFSSKSAPEEVHMTHHWDILATDVAVQIKLALENAGIYDNLPIYVETSGETAFGENLRDLITVRLEELGLPVTQEKADAVFILENSVQVICHLTREIIDPPADRSAAFVNLSEDVAVERNGGKTPGKEKIETPGDAEVARSSGVFAPTEVAITTSLVNDTDLLLQSSDIYYIKDPEFWRYMAASRMGEQASGQAPSQDSEPAATPVSEGVEQPTEQISESQAVVVPAPVSMQNADQSPMKTQEQVTEGRLEAVPEEMPKPLPELKVKGHF